MEAVDAEVTLADRLLYSRPHLANALVDDKTFDWLLQTARSLPGNVMAALEVRLAKEQPEVDLSVRLLEPRQAEKLASNLTDSPGFLRRFLRDWARAAPADRDPGLHSLWLEFDSAGLAHSRPLPDPIVCARLRRSASLDWVIRELLPAMHGSPLPTLQKQLFRRAWRAIPSSCRPLYAFSLRARGRQGVRLEMYAEDLHIAWTWLQRMGHPSASTWLSAARAHLPRVDRLHLSCDVEPGGWTSRIGLEGSFQRQPHRQPAWRQWIRYLEDQDLCDPGKGASLEAWVGRRSAGTGSLVRALSHLKLSFHEEAKPNAKAYLIFQHLN